MNTAGSIYIYTNFDSGVSMLCVHVIYANAIIFKILRIFFELSKTHKLFFTYTQLVEKSEVC